MGNLSQEVGLVVVVSFFLLLVAVGIVVLVLVYRRKQVEYIHEQNRLKAAFEKELLEAQLEIQEQTLKHVAQEIHDNIGQTLSLVKLNLATIAPEKQNGTIEKITTTRELVAKAITDLRTLSKTMHTDTVMAVGLEKAIEMELKYIDKAAVFKTRLAITGQPISLDPQKELILFRTVQEALNNSIKHSSATLIQISLHFTPGQLQLTIQDNGKGFQMDAVEKHPENGSGLRNMQNRAKMIGGRLTFDSVNGTTVYITLPIVNNESSDSVSR